MMKEKWDERYGSPDYVYGKEPNEFFRDTLATLKPGRILLPGEGEGRNAAWAAGLGWEVDAFDFSAEGRKKALALAGGRGLSIRYEVIEADQFVSPGKVYDLAASIFFHLEPEARYTLHRKMVASLKHGGKILLEAFSPKQLGMGTGGPSTAELMVTVDDLKRDFRDLKIEVLEEILKPVYEGAYHTGDAWVVRFLGTHACGR